MGENSKIEWCDHTFNPWIGCQKLPMIAPEDMSWVLSHIE